MSGADGNEVNPQAIRELPKMTSAELAGLERLVAAEFRDLGRSYIQARLVRINQMIEKLLQLIKLATANDKNWLKIYNFEIETINNITTNTEDLVLVKDGVLLSKADLLKSVDEYEEELKEIFKNLQSPLDFDESLNKPEESRLPFPYLFDQVFQDHKTGLKTIINEKDYQTRLLKTLSKSNSSIIWKQYFHKMCARKRQLIDETMDELYQLERQYRHHDSRVIHYRNQHYYRSVLSTNDLVRSYDDKPFNTTKVNTTNTTDLDEIVPNNRDPNYANLDNMYLQKNKIEMTNIRRDILNKFHNFSYSQCFDDQVPNKRTKLQTCSGLSENQIDQDLFLISKGIREQDGESVDDVVDVQEDVEDEEDEDEEDEEDEDESNEEEDDDDEEDEDEDVSENGMNEELAEKYRHLLGVDKSPGLLSAAPLKMPPLEAFPNLL